YLVLAGICALIWFGALLRGRPKADGRLAAAEEPESELQPWTARVGEIGAALRDWGTLRWLLLIEVADLLVDVFTGFLALYLVDVAHLAPAVAALGIALRRARPVGRE